MAPARAFWKGYLKLSLVSCPIALYTGTSSTERVSFRQINNLTVKSIGGVEIGLGVLGKLSIGDNSTLTDLVQASVSEIVGRLTVALAAPILEAIDIEQQPVLQAKLQATAPTHAAARKTTSLNVIRAFSTPFLSAGGG
jgi:hypothetical protein